MYISTYFPGLDPGQRTNTRPLGNCQRHVRNHMAPTHELVRHHQYSFISSTLVIGEVVSRCIAGFVTWIVNWHLAWLPAPSCATYVISCCPAWNNSPGSYLSIWINKILKLTHRDPTAYPRFVDVDDIDVVSKYGLIPCHDLGIYIKPSCFWCTL